MADPLSIIGGFAAILQISSAVVNLISNVKGAPGDRQKLLEEIRSTTSLCRALYACAKVDSEPWMETFQTLCESDGGPVVRFQADLEHLHDLLAPGQRQRTAPATESKFKSLIQSIKWPFTKNEVREILADIERQKSLFALAMTNDNLRLSNTIHEEVHKLNIRFEAFQIAQDSEKKKALLAGLSKIDFEATHAEISSRRASGTGKWLIGSEEFSFWSSSSKSSALWCQGIPGSGKTILAGLVLDQLRFNSKKDPSIGVAGIYCSYSDPQTIASYFGSLLRQLATPLDCSFTHLSISDTENVGRMLTLLSDIVSSYEQFFLVVDALDECPNRLELMKQLQILKQISSMTLVRILVTSRSGITDIERDFQADERLEIRSDENDVRLYLQQSLREQPYISEWIAEDIEFEKSIIEAILSRLSGIFLLARLYVDLLAHIPTKRGVRRALTALPEGPDSTYAEAWKRICSQKPHQAELGKRVLSWIICSESLLHVEELRYGLAIEDDDKRIDREGLLDINSLTSFCAGLVVIDEKRQLVGVVHPTTYEYFIENRERLLPTAHDVVATACTTYLLMNSLAIKGACSRIADFNKRCRQHPLLRYAAVHWGTHVRLSASDANRERSSRLLNHEKARAAAVQALVLKFDYYSASPTKLRPDEFESSQKSVSALHIAAYFGLVDQASVLLGEDANVDELDAMGASPVHWALLGQQNVMLKFLIELGASLQIQQEVHPVPTSRWFSATRRAEFAVPLHIASHLGNAEAVELLLLHGAPLDQLTDYPGKSMIPMNALVAALSGGQMEIARILLARRINLRHVCLFFRNIQDDHVEVLELLIDAGAYDYCLSWFLDSATDRLHPKTLRLLLEKGIRPDGELYLAHGEGRSRSDYSVETIQSRDKSQEHPHSSTDPQFNTSTLLISVIASSNPGPASECLMLLVNAGANVNQICRRNYYHVSSWEALPLNETGTYVEWKTQTWDPPDLGETTPLHAAAYYGKLDLIRLLVQKGANVNMIVRGDCTPIVSALESEGYRVEGSIGDDTSSLRVRAVLQLLLDLGADSDLGGMDSRRRIEQVLHMTPDQCNRIRSLQKLLEVVGFWDFDGIGFRERKQALEILLQDGDHSLPLCERTRQHIGRFLSLSECALNTLDAECFAISKGLPVADDYSSGSDDSSSSEA